MTDIARNEIKVIERVVGNNEAIGGYLKDINGAAIDLTGKSVVFRMVNMTTGTVKVNNASAVVVTPGTGQVRYDPTAGDVDTAGRYAMYFLDNSSPQRRWPYDGARFQLVLKTEGTT